MTDRQKGTSIILTKLYANVAINDEENAYKEYYEGRTQQD